MKKWHYIFCIILFHLGLPCGMRQMMARVQQEAAHIH